MVTCAYTMDNVVSGVYQNGILSQAQAGDADWSALKTITFESNAGFLAIKGFEAEAMGSASISGLLVSCESTDAADPWHHWAQTPTTGWQRARPAPTTPLPTGTRATAAAHGNSPAKA